MVAFGAAQASVSEESSRSIQSALGALLSEEPNSTTLLALWWYEQSKRATIGADRFLALWIALEALMGPTRNHAELVKQTAQYLTKEEFGLGSDPEAITRALGLDYMRKARNTIMHEGQRMVPWPVSDRPDERDWPQILDEIVGEVLRYELGTRVGGILEKRCVIRG